jgi:hypothetical protein
MMPRSANASSAKKRLRVPNGKALLAAEESSFWGEHVDHPCWQVLDNWQLQAMSIQPFHVHDAPSHHTQGIEATADQCVISP